MSGKYDPETHPREANILCTMGATDREICEFFQIGVATFYNWRNSHPEFAMALVDGKDIADDRVERALYNRAVGYSYDAVKFITVSVGNNGGSEVEKHDYVEHVPPDVKACIRWLEARRPKTWRRTLAVTDDAPALTEEEQNFDGLDGNERTQLRDLLSKAASRAGQPRLPN